jgi:carboxyl-terminal processing protease
MSEDRDRTEEQNIDNDLIDQSNEQNDESLFARLRQIDPDDFTTNQDEYEDTDDDFGEVKAVSLNLGRALLQGFVAFLIFCLFCMGALLLLLNTNYNNLGNLARVLQYINAKYVDEVPTEQLVEGAINGMISTLDPYSSFQSDAERQKLLENIQGQVGGVGVLISTADPSRLLVVRTIQDSSAFEAGILPGDVIVSADGTDLTGMTQDEAITYVRGEAGTEVKLGIQREDEARQLEMTLLRQVIAVPSVEGALLPGHDDIVIVNISNFTMNTGEEFAAVLQEFKIAEKSGLILDLRYNYGGEVNSSLRTAGFLVPGTEVLHVVNREGKETIRTSNSAYINKPLVVLVNQYSASAAEIVAGAVKDYESGVLVGKKTFGKGVMQTVFNIALDSSLILTTDRYLTAGGHDIHGIGILPDVEVDLAEGEKVTIMPTDEQFDSQLQAAVDKMTELIAASEAANT